jgi:hypothetical protein
MSVSTKAISDGLLVGQGAAAVLALPNDGRDLIIIHNQQYVLYVKCGLNAALNDYTYRLTRNATLELPGYIGAVSAIAEDGTTYVRVTELL